MYFSYMTFTVREFIYVHYEYIDEEQPYEAACKRIFLHFAFTSTKNGPT